MQLSRLERAAIIADLKAIATRLAGAPAHTERLAKADLERHRTECPNAYRDANHYPHMTGGLQHICESTARDLEAIIRRLGGGS